MAGVGCLLKDTAIIQDLADILKDLAAEYIANDRVFTLNEAFNIIKGSGLEIDLESVAYVYENEFNLMDANFSSQQQVDTLIGRDFYEMLDKISHTRPFTGELKIDRRSPGKAAADKIAQLFKSGMSLNEGTMSEMRLFQEKMYKAAKAFADKGVFPDKSRVDNRGFEEILADAFEFNEKGIETVYGTLNSAMDVFEEFKDEIRRYVAGLQAGVNAGTVNADALAQFEIYAQGIIDKSFDLLLSQKEMNAVIKDALTAAGFVKVTSPGGVRTVVLDWQQLTDGANDVNFLKDNVSEAMRKFTSFTEPQIDVINAAMEREYVRLREDIIAKRLANLKERNEIAINPEKNTQTRTLAKLYAMGWFEAAPDAYEKIVNKALSLEDIDVDTFNELQVLGKALHTLYKENYASDEYTKTATNAINEQIGTILNRYAANKSGLYKTARYINGYLSMALRALLTSISNSFLANQISGLEAKGRNNLFSMIRGESNSQKREFKRRLSRNVFKDIALTGGLQYGDLSSTYMNRNEFDTWLNSLSDSKIYHTVVSAVTGRALLDGSDSYFKASLVHNYFIHNITKILVDKFGYNKQDAINEINQQLYGTSFEDMVVEARTVVDKINTQAGKIIVKDNVENIERLAADMIMANLLKVDDRINHEIVTRAYRASYDAGGYEIGHVPNNFLSELVSGYNSKIQQRVKSALRDGNYKLASRWSLTQTVYNTWVNPFGNGGMNWVFIMGERMGLGILRSLNKDFKRFADVDISTNEGINDLQDALFNENKKDVQFKRGVFGALTNLIMFATVMAFISEGGDDDEEKKSKLDKFGDFFEENKWFRKYTVSLSLEYTFMAAMLKTGNYDYMLKLLNLQYDRYKFSSIITEAIKLKGKGEDAEAIGKLGEAFGTMPVNPITIHRLYSQIDELSSGLGSLYTGVPLPPRQFTKSRSFLMGYFNYGMVNDMGLFKGNEWYDIRNPSYDLSSLPGAGEATLGKMKDMGFGSIEDLKKHIYEKFPGQSISVGLRSIKTKDKAGRMMPLFDKNDAAQIEEIIENGNRLPSITIGDTVKDAELLKKFKGSGIATMSQLVGAIDNGSFDALVRANNVSEKDEKFMRDQAKAFLDEIIKK